MNDDEVSAEQVVFISSAGPGPGEFDVHSGFGGKIVRSLTEVKEDWRLILGQVADIVSSGTDQVASRGLRFKEVEVSLGFDAKGRLAFIAEAGVQATVRVTFDAPPQRG
jgi:hypothetical protein